MSSLAVWQTPDDGDVTGAVAFLLPLAELRLADYLRGRASSGRYGVPDIPSTCLAAAGISDALAYLHRSPKPDGSGPVVHNDVKPENILQVGGTWLLGDLGIASPPGREGVSARVGSLAYLAPEHLADGRGGKHPAGDVWVRPVPVALTLAMLAAGGVGAAITYAAIPPSTSVKVVEQFASYGTARSLVPGQTVPVLAQPRVNSHIVTRLADGAPAGIVCTSHGDTVRGNWGADKLVGPGVPHPCRAHHHGARWSASPDLLPHRHRQGGLRHHVVKRMRAPILPRQPQAPPTAGRYRRRSRWPLRRPGLSGFGTETNPMLQDVVAT